MGKRKKKQREGSPKAGNYVKNWRKRQAEKEQKALERGRLVKPKKIQETFNPSPYNLDFPADTGIG
jgi:hypothetical protein